ncbi:MAG: hypothetical protein CMG00_05300 [Candidatus Marinimicrobia bacterium]|nr:hypothetical protein [Candidatus Neomarinimicrobiota bacterium]|tara:strand:- start:7417 stop:7890 length:474 start_codon:yes stop_codon:yes gene_type:complete
MLFFLYSCTVSPRYSSDSSSKNNSVKKARYSSSSYNKSTSKKQQNAKQTVFKGVSSYYGPNFHGKLTANGEVYDMYGVTAAHKTLPFNTVARVTNLDNNKSLILRINDRGPYVGDRILDCSYGAAKKLDFLNQGTANVELKIIEWGDGEYMHHINAK